MIRTPLVPFLLLAIVCCSATEAVDVSSRAATRSLMNRCVTIRKPVFLVRRNKSKYPEVPRTVVAPPGTLYAPFAVADYRRDPSLRSQYATVIRLVQVGEAVSVRRVLLLKDVEGTTLSIVGTLSSAANEEVDITFLFDYKARIALLDAANADAPPAETNSWFEGHAAFCDERSGM